MSEMTKGPWAFAFGVVWEQAPGDHDALASMCLDKPIPEVQANGRLMAAAPDLLAALEEMLDWAVEERDDNPGLPYRCIFCDERGQTKGDFKHDGCPVPGALAAIAKAKGEGK